MKKSFISSATMPVITASIAIAVAAWFALQTRDDMRQITSRQSDLAQLLLLKQDVVAAAGSQDRANAEDLIRRHLGSAVSLESSEETAGEGWTIRRHTVIAADIAPAGMDALFAACEASTPRLLPENIEVAAVATGRLSVRLVIAELVKN